MTRTSAAVALPQKKSALQSSSGGVSRGVRGESIGRREQAMKNRWLRRVLSLLLLATVLSITQVWSRMEVLKMRYRLTDMQRRTEELGKSIDRSATVNASMKSVERLTKIARDELGMVAPVAGQIIVVRAHGPEVRP